MAGKFRKTAGVLLLIAAVLISQIPVDASASTDDFKMNGSTLVQYTGNDENVVIPSKVKVIGEDAFSGNLTVKTVTIPNSVKEIRYHAFSGCDLLTKVTIGDSVESIGTAAFSDCSALTEVTIGKGLKSMGSGVFAGCPSLSNMMIESTRYHCRGGVLYDENETALLGMLGGCKTTAFQMPSTVTRIEPYAFWDCGQLEYVSLSSAMSDIPAYAFAGCTGLKAVSIPYSVKRIDAKAFAGCSNLGYAEIPSAVTWIHSTAFEGCYQLKPVVETGSAAERFFSSMDLSAVSRTEYEDVVNTILDGAVTQADGYTKPTPTPTGAAPTGTVAPTSAPAPSPIVHETYYNPLYYEENVLGKTMVVSGDAVVFIDNTKQYVYQTGDGLESYYAEAPGDAQVHTLTRDADVPADPYSDEEKGIYFPKYAVIDGQRIANQAFYKQSALTSYTFDEGIEKIGDFAFARTGLSDVRLPDGLTTIGYGAFYHCDDLSEVVIPDSVREIEPYAFAGTPWLTEWTNGYGEEFLIVGDGILLAYRGSGSKIVVPEGVKTIAHGCFMGHQGIVSVSLPISLEVICEEAFSGCGNLMTVSGGVNLRRIEDRAFAGCPLSTIKIGSSVSEVGLRAFDTAGTIEEGKSVSVDFQGEVLPTVSLVQTSQRLYYESYRDIAFCGMDTAMVSHENVVIDGTVLDPAENGFRGVICCFNDDPVMTGSMGTEHGNVETGDRGVTILKCTVEGSSPDRTRLPDSIFYYGKAYPVTRVSEDVFSYYGQGEDGRSVLPADDATGQNDQEQITVSLRSNVLTKPDCVRAEASGIENAYRLTIADDVIAKQEMLRAYQALYGDTEHLLLYGFNIHMEDENGISITGLGRKNMMLTLPVPEEIEPANAKILCVDEDGQLESVSAKLTEIDGQPCLQFYARHFSYYGIYTFLNDAGDQIGHGKLDASPDTGDYVHPKWFLCIGLAATAMVLFLWRDRKKNRPAAGSRI